MASASVTKNRELARHELIAGLLTAVRPQMPALTDVDLRELADNPESFFERIRPQLLEQDVWEHNAPDWYLNDYSFGVGHKLRIRERLYKRAFPETLNIRLDGEVRALTNDGLLELARAIGALPAAPRALTA